MFESSSPINHGLYRAVSIASSANIETEATYEDRIPFYKERSFTYIPLPFERKFYDIDNREMKEMNGEQFVHFDHFLMKILHIHRSNPFILLEPMYNSCRLYDERPADRDVFELSGDSDVPSYIEIISTHSPTSPNEFRVRDAVAEYPSLKSDFRDIFENKFHIVTPADLNKREARKLPFNIIAELEMTIAKKIKEEYPDSRDLFPHARPHTIGRWQKACLEGTEIHIAEYMTLSGLLKVVGKSNSLLEECGFPSRNQLKKQLGSLDKVRNRVMHTNRTLVHGQEDIEKLVDRLQRAEGAISQIQQMNYSTLDGC